MTENTREKKGKKKSSYFEEEKVSTFVWFFTALITGLEQYFLALRSSLAGFRS